MIERGNKKWSSIMTPELVQGLQQIIEDEKNIEKPLLSEDQYEELERTISEAIKYNLNIEITYYKSMRLYTITGKIKYLNSLQIQINTGGNLTLISTKNIINANRV